MRADRWSYGMVFDMQEGFWTDQRTVAVMDQMMEASVPVRLLEYTMDEDNNFITPEKVLKYNFAGEELYGVQSVS